MVSANSCDICNSRRSFKFISQNKLFLINYNIVFVENFELRVELSGYEGLTSCFRVAAEGSLKGFNHLIDFVYSYALKMALLSQGNSLMVYWLI